MTLVALVLFALLTRAQNLSCRFLEIRSNYEISKDSLDKRLFRFDSLFLVDVYQDKMKATKTACIREVACTMIFTLEEINRNNKLLPGVALEYRIFNTCGNQNLLSAAMAAVVGPEKQYMPGEDCTRGRVQALIRHSSSGPSGIVSKTIAPLYMPLISHLSTCECLSNRYLYPTFFRTALSGRFQKKALVELLKHFDWMWIGYLYSTETYSEEGTAELIKIAKEDGIFTEYILQFLDTAPEKTVLSIALIIKSFTPKADLAFMSMSYFQTFSGMTKEMNITAIQQIGSELYVSTRDFFLNLWLSSPRTFWETVFGCSPSACSTYRTPLSSQCCTSSHCLFLTNVRVVVCEMAHMPDTMTHSQSSTYFCGNNNSFPAEQVPRPNNASRKWCKAGKQKAVNRRRPPCCFDCKICSNGDTWDILPCSLKTQPEEDFHQNISFVGILNLLLTTFSVLGLCLTAATVLTFLQHSQNPPVVRANNSELSFLLLFSLTLCFLCSLTFIGRPSQWSCMLRHTVFGVTFVLCISCVLGKTIVVLMAFRATLPGSNVMKWFGPPQQRLSVLAFTLIQVLICVLWLTLSPPFPNKNMKYYKDKIILECDVGSAVGFWAVLGYIGLLSVMYFVLAFLARILFCADVKFLSLSIFIYCATWTAFIQMYVRSQAKYTITDEMISILA